MPIVKSIRAIKKLKGLTPHDIWGAFKRWRKSVNFITTILLYAAITSVVCSSLLYLIENSDGYVHLPYMDALFLGVSAFTASGLNSIKFSDFSVPSLVMIYLTMQFGSIVLLTTLPSILRVRTFRRRLQQARTGLNNAETEKDAILQIAYVDALSKRANICYVIIFSCVFYWFICQFVWFFLVLVDKDPWWSLFHVTSAFNNAGFALAPNNMYPIRENNYLLLAFSLLMPLGNTLFPVFFRLQMIATLYITDTIAVRYGDAVFCGSSLRDWVDAIETFVDKPRDHFTHMFAPKETFILFILWVVLTVAEFIMFIPEFNTAVFPPESLNSLSNQLCIAVFQTVTVRTCGFSAMNLDDVHIGHLAFWALMMYISTYPFIVAEQVTSSAAEEDDGKSDYTKYKEQAVGFVGRDLIWLYLVVMAITISENYDILTDVKGRNDNFLRVLFEVSSAFGTVGLSLAYPTPSGVSFSGDLTNFSKFMIILTMFAGKHRGLPPAVDKSIMISESAMLDEMSDLAQPPSEDASERGNALMSVASNHSGRGDSEEDATIPLLTRGQSLMLHGNRISTRHNKDVVHGEFGSVKPTANPGWTSPGPSPTSVLTPQFPAALGYSPPTVRTDGPSSLGRRSNGSPADYGSQTRNSSNHESGSAYHFPGGALSSVAHDSNVAFQLHSNMQTTPYTSASMLDPSRLPPVSLDGSSSSSSSGGGTASGEVVARSANTAEGADTAISQGQSPGSPPLSASRRTCSGVRESRDE